MVMPTSGITRSMLNAPFETLAKLLSKGNFLSVPTNTGLTATLVGTGASSQTVSHALVNTGTTTSSSALLYSDIHGFAGTGQPYSYINWDKKLYFIFQTARYASNANAVGHTQLKEVTTIGELGAKGIGLRADNLDLVGTSYGTALGEVTLSALTSFYLREVTIVLTPGSKIEWFLDGVLGGTQSTAAAIPSGNSSTTLRLMISIINGATATDSYNFINQPKIWQAR